MYATTMRDRSGNPSPIRLLIGYLQRAQRALDFAAPAGDLSLRLWVAAAFFQSGLVKAQSMATTILLFEYEYHVPLLPPALAAYMAMAGELAFSALLALGIAGRLAACGLFFVNVVAVLSYPDLMEAGRAMHVAWGVVLFALALRGPGALSADHWFARRLGWH